MTTPTFDVLGAPDFAMTHRMQVSGTPDEIYRALSELRVADLPLAGILFAIRRAPALLLGKTPVTVAKEKRWIDNFVDEGFVVLHERPPRELVLGVVGRFWELTSGVVKVGTAEAFHAFARPGFAKAVLVWRIEEAGPGRSEVVTETQIRALDGFSRLRFGLYWTLIRLGSGLIRREMLAQVKRRVEGEVLEPVAKR
jgi:hypothetical protein